ncbi:MAG: hypothetical protein HYY10_02235 [Candidatus Liptonbacteria bacterium]|nr:hypothetical protein [Candidatus Liptonbacteria bacterium]
MTFSPQQKTSWVTGGFALAGIIAAHTKISDWTAAAPLVVFYTTMLINTYFCVRIFAALVPPHNRTQQTFDALLGIIYVALAFTFPSPLFFIFTATLLFAVATLKYAMLAYSIGHSSFLHKKISIDAMGTLACVLALGGVLAGRPLLATSIWALAFVVTNIYLLVVNPMYPRALPPQQQEQ